jgi:hypothetical protein
MLTAMLQILESLSHVPFGRPRVCADARVHVCVRTRVHAEIFLVI